MSTYEKCYRCERSATSKEHVPPKCLFPEKKDSDNVDYRSDLITVPSCDIHNTAKSKEDQFLMLCLARIVGNNEIGLRLGNSKVKRTLKRAPHTIESIFKWREESIIEIDNQLWDIVKGVPDADRLENCFISIFYGIYRHHFGKNFSGQISVFMDFLHYPDEKRKNLKKQLQIRAPKELEGKEIFGSNPKVFSYQFGDLDEDNILLCKTTCYDNVIVYASFVTEEPDNFILNLMGSAKNVIFDDKNDIIIIKH